MGKVKHARKSFHASAPKPMDVVKPDFAVQETLPTSCIPLFSGHNIFKNIQIPESILKQQTLDTDFDRRSTVTVKSVGTINNKERTLTKKEKRLLKRESFLQKIEAFKVAKIKIKEDEKRRQTPVVGNMQVLSDALPMLDCLLKEVKDTTTNEKPRASKSLKQQQKAMMQDIEAFHQVQSHPAYVSDPFGTISTHVKNLIESEQQ